MAWDDLLATVDAAIVATTGILQWGQPIEYRTADGTASFNATRNTSKQEYEQVGVWVRDVDVLWMMRKSDLVIDGTAIDLKRNDVISDGTGLYYYMDHEPDPDTDFFIVGTTKQDV